MSKQTQALSRRAVLALLPAWLAACASSTQAPAARLQLPLLHLPPAELGRSLSLVQRLSVYRLDAPEAAPQSVEVQLEADAQHLRLAGFALGQRVLMLQWDGQQLSVQRHPLLPAEVDTARMLRDLCLVYWPEAALKAHLPEGWSLQLEAGLRRLFHESQEVLRIAFEPQGPDGEKIELLNRVEAYRLVIESQSQAQ